MDEFDPSHNPYSDSHDLHNQKRGGTGVRQRVFDMILEIKYQGREPKKIYLTAADEQELAEANEQALGTVLYEKIREQGVRKAMRRYMGMRVFWDADETKVK